MITIGGKMQLKFPIQVNIDAKQGYRFSHYTIEPCGKQWYEAGTKPDKLQDVYSLKAVFVPLIDESISSPRSTFYSDSEKD